MQLNFDKEADLTKMTEVQNAKYQSLIDGKIEVVQDAPEENAQDVPVNLEEMNPFVEE